MSTVVRFYEYGSPGVLKVEDETVSEPGAGQVRLRQETIGVNFIDTEFRLGTFPMPLPGITGVEGAGIVDAVGSGVEGIKIGDRMAYFLAPGAYAEQRSVNAADLVPIPADISSAQAATILTKGLTAWAGLNGFHCLAPGETVLVQGASGNVGLLLSRWAKARGARVIGTAGSENKRAALLGFVDHAFLSGSADLADHVRAVAPRGVDVVYDFVGKATFPVSSAVVRDGGTIVTIGAASGDPKIDRVALALRRVHVVGGPMTRYLEGSLATAVAQVFDAYRKGTFGDFEASVYSLRDAAQAHEDIAARRKAAPMILVP